MILTAYCFLVRFYKTAVIGIHGPDRAAYYLDLDLEDEGIMAALLIRR